MSLDILQLQSLGTAAVGNAIATYVLGKEGAPAVPTLTSIATILPQIPLGKASPTQMGTLQGQLNKIQANLTASKAANESVGSPPVNIPQTLSQLGSLIALVTSSQPSASGGLTTPDQALASQYLGNVSSGITNAVQFWQGEQAAV
jgi:hypothetical protein